MSKWHITILPTLIHACFKNSIQTLLTDKLLLGSIGPRDP